MGDTVTLGVNLQELLYEYQHMCAGLLGEQLFTGVALWCGMLQPGA